MIRNKNIISISPKSQKMANLYGEVVDICIKKLGENYSIKQKQFEAIDSILRGRDTLAILPTGYGKSLIYQLLPSIFSMLPNRPGNGIVIVISALRALINDQVSSANNLKQLNLRASSLGSSTFNSLLNGSHSIIIDTPEMWLEDKKWRDMLSFSVFRKNLIAIVVDEAH